MSFLDVFKLPVDVIDFKPIIWFKGIATMVIRYGALNIHGELCIYIDKETKIPKLWVRLPEFWRNDEKNRYVWLDTAEVSEMLQKVLLEQLHKKYGVTLKSSVDFLEKHRAEEIKNRKKKQKVSTSSGEKIKVAK